MRVNLRAVAILAFAGLVAASPPLASVGGSTTSVPYKDPGQPVDVRVEDLLRRMTLDEKVAQLETVWESKAKLQDAVGTFSPELVSHNFPNGIGGFARPS